MQKVLLDSSVWIAYLSERDFFNKKARLIVTSAIEEELRIYVPYLVYLEVLSALIRRNVPRVIIDYFFNIIYNSGSCKLFYSTFHQQKASIERLLYQSRLKVNDLLIVQSALYLEANLFTFDEEQLNAYNKAAKN